jgi:hypothetical protein
MCFINIGFWQKLKSIVAQTHDFNTALPKTSQFSF